jgi:hypothetical protein
MAGEMKASSALSKPARRRAIKDFPLGPIADAVISEKLFGENY